MSLNETNRFREYLEKKGLSWKSVQTYRKIANIFFKNYSEVNAENINKFLAEQNRKNKRYYNAKYAFKHLLDFHKKRRDYKKLMNITQKPPQRKYITTIDSHMLREMINNIGNEKMKLIARLQFATGARAVGIIRLHRKNINERNDGKVSITLWEKGDKQRNITLPQKLSNDLLDYCSRNIMDYIFLDGRSKNGISGKVSNTYNYYYKTIKNMLGKHVGKDYCLGTHNFRVLWISDFAEKTNGNIIATQQAAGHSRVEQTMEYIRKYGNFDITEKVMNKDEERKNA